MGLFFDVNKGDIGFAFNDRWGMGSDGNLKHRISDNLAMDMESGDIGLVAGWEDEDDDDDGIKPVKDLSIARKNLYNVNDMSIARKKLYDGDEEDE